MAEGPRDSLVFDGVGWWVQGCAVLVRVSIAPREGLI